MGGGIWQVVGRPIGEGRQDGRGEWVQRAVRAARGRVRQRERGGGGPRESGREDEREGEFVSRRKHLSLPLFLLFLLSSDDSCGGNIYLATKN